MSRVRLGAVLSFGLMLMLGGGRANALPGQTAEEVGAWIQAHPTLRPVSGERLLVRKSDSAAQRFTFQASVLAPGRVIPARDSSTIRSERLSIFDMINGVTRDRLEESLRVIYGLGVYQDYERANLVYRYPGEATAFQARRRVTPLMAALQGELRMGDRYAYWTEIAENRNGNAYAGHVVVFLKSDLNKLETELRNR
ncbi:MAG TPA: hypothetical protein V6D16_01185 [Candidatus Obscuribacterales bacterium]